MLLPKYIFALLLQLNATMGNVSPSLVTKLNVYFESHPTIANAYNKECAANGDLKFNEVLCSYWNVKEYE